MKKLSKIISLVLVMSMSLVTVGCNNSQEKKEGQTADVNAIMNAGYSQGMKETAEQIRDVYQREGGYYGSKEHAVPVMTNPRAAAFWVPPTLYREMDLIAQGRWVDLKIKDSDWYVARRNELDPYHLVHFRVKQRQRVEHFYNKENHTYQKGKTPTGYPYPVTLNSQQRTQVEQVRQNQDKEGYQSRSEGPMPGRGETIEFSR